MEKVTVDIEILKKMLQKAYESGWHGSLELSEATTEDIIKENEANLGKVLTMDQVPYQYDNFTHIISDQITYSGEPINITIGDGLTWGQITTTGSGSFTVQGTQGPIGSTGPDGPEGPPGEGVPPDPSPPSEEGVITIQAQPVEPRLFTNNEIQWQYTNNLYG